MTLAQSSFTEEQIKFNFERLEEVIQKQNKKEGFETSSGEKRHDVSVDEFMFMHSDESGLWFKHVDTRNYVLMQEFLGKYNLQIPKCNKAFLKGEF